MPLTPREIYERELARQRARDDAQDAREAKKAATLNAAGYERARRQYGGCACGCVGLVACALVLVGCWLVGVQLERWHRK